MTIADHQHNTTPYNLYEPLTVKAQPPRQRSDVQPNQRGQQPDNYYVKWSGGDLGVALISHPVCVSRVTGKGSPDGLEHVRRGHVLLAINGVPTKHLHLDEVVRILGHCALPATLHFAKPDFDDFWMYPRSKSLPSFSPSALGLETPRPRRLSFSPPRCYIEAATDSTPTSPRHSVRPTSSRLADKRVTSGHGPRHSAPY